MKKLALFWLGALAGGGTVVLAVWVPVLLAPLGVIAAILLTMWAISVLAAEP